MTSPTAAIQQSQSTTQQRSLDIPWTASQTRWTGEGMEIASYQPNAQLIIDHVFVDSLYGYYHDCATPPSVLITDGTASISFPLSASNQMDSGGLNQQFTSGGRISMQLTPASGCGLTGSTPSIHVTVQMQPF
jgi:hypothetical protein